MIDFERFVLKNGLIVISHYDNSTPLVAIDVLYKVGSRNEKPDKTGFAHLFEHLMFSGSENAPDFDGPVQLAGGESNAFTNTDSTNFYEILPAENIETSLWLESDRMKYLICDENAFSVQQKVVIEEFKETTLNQPYGDAWHTIAASSFNRHPYRWPTIGLTPKHIEEAKLSDVQHFYDKFYNPNNAILSIAGNIKPEKVFELAEKWFGDIPNGEIVKRDWENDKAQKEYKKVEKKAKVPLRSLYLAFHMGSRFSDDYYVGDVISDILSGGRSSRFYQRLMKKQELISYADAYITGTLDPGLFLIEGKPNPSISIENLKEAIWKELDHLKEGKISDQELEKIKNKIESALVYSEVNILNKAVNLAYYEMIGNAELINKQIDLYNSITKTQISDSAQKIFQLNNCTEVVYYPE